MKDIKMEMAIFESVIIDSVLTELEAEGKKYEGLYVDMENAPERKYVKDKAALISTIKKQVDRKRIDAAKLYKSEVESQATAIHARLDAANAPFIDLMNVYTAERKKILDAKKANEAALELRAKIEDDHEMALLMNKTWAYDREEVLREAAKVEAERLAGREAYAKEQVKIAEQRQALNQQQAEQQKINEENARLASKEHVQSVKTEIYKVLRQFELSDKDAKTVIHLATINELPNLTINY